MPNNSVNSAINENCGANDAFSFWCSTFLSEFSTSQQDDDNTEHQQNPSSVYKEIERVIVVKDEDQYDWQKH
jgi:hypothetical protein